MIPIITGFVDVGRYREMLLTLIVKIVNSGEPISDISGDIIGQERIEMF